MRIEEKELCNKNLFEIIGSYQISILSSSYALSNVLKQEGFILLMEQLLMINSQMQNLIILAFHGEKEAFYKIKEDFDQQIKHFLKSYVEVVEEKAHKTH